MVVVKAHVVFMRKGSRLVREQAPGTTGSRYKANVMKSFSFDVLAVYW